MKTFHNCLIVLVLSQVKDYFTVLIFLSSLETLKYFEEEKWLKLNKKPKILK